MMGAMGGMGMPPMGGMPGMPPAAAAGGALPAAAAPGPGGAPPFDMAAMMAAMGGQPGGAMPGMPGMPPPQPAAPADARPPEERFRDQLDQLMGMGFADQASNIQALQATQGNVQLAIERLLNM